MPKPPPTSSTTTRTFSRRDAEHASHSVSRAPDGIWLDRRSVSRSAVGVVARPWQLRGSIGVGARRWLTRSSDDDMRGGLAKAASVAAASPCLICAAMLPVAAGQTSGAPGARRLRQLGDGGQLVIFDHDGVERVLRHGAASRPPRATTASPTKRTTSCASAGRSGDAPGEPSGRLNIGASGSGLHPGRDQVGAGQHRHHARHRQRRRGVDRDDPGMRDAASAGSTR